MTSLDTIARNSATAVHTSVARVGTPAMGIARVAHAAAMWKIAGYAVAGATAGVAILFALVISAPTEQDPADNIVPTTSAVVPTTIPTAVVETQTTPTTPSEAPQEEPVAAVAGDDSAKPQEPVDIEPPLLKVLSPTDGEHFDKALVTFSGVTEAGAKVVASGKFPASVASDGSWAVNLVLAKGGNGVVITSEDAAGNLSEVRLIVHLDEEPPKETTTTVAKWDFTASQKFGSCSEPVPYDVFDGKAQPGTTVTVSSAYGNGSTTSNGEGKWSLRVDFPSAPYNEQFSVTVMDHTGAKKSFSFISLYEG